MKKSVKRIPVYVILNAQKAGIDFAVLVGRERTYCWLLFLEGDDSPKNVQIYPVDGDIVSETVWMLRAFSFAELHEVQSNSDRLGAVKGRLADFIRVSSETWSAIQEASEYTPLYKGRSPIAEIVLELSLAESKENSSSHNG